MTVLTYSPSPAPPGWWRAAPDSSHLTEPHPYVVVFVPQDEVDRHAADWAAALGQPLDARLPLPHMGLIVVTVGHVAVIGATPEALASSATSGPSSSSPTSTTR